MKSLSRLLVLVLPAVVVVGGLAAPHALAAQVASIDVSVAGQQPSQTILTQGGVSATVGDTLVLNNISGSQVAVMDPSGSVITDSQGYPCNAPSCSLPSADTQTYTLVGSGNLTITAQGAAPAILGVTTSSGPGITTSPPEPPAPKYRLTFDWNGANCPRLESPEIANTAWTTTPLATCSNGRYVLAGWSTSTTDRTGLFFKPGDPVQVTGANTLYAQWDYTVTTHWYPCLDNDTVQVVVPGATVTLPSDVSCSAVGGGRAHILLNSSGPNYLAGQTITPTGPMYFNAGYSNFTTLTLTCPVGTEIALTTQTMWPTESAQVPAVCGSQPIEVWTTVADGSGDGYDPDHPFTAGTGNANVTLYGQLPGHRVITIAWDAGGGTCTQVTSKVAWGAAFQPVACQKSGSALVGWQIDGRSIKAGDALRPDKSKAKVTALALWQQIPRLAVGWGFGVSCAAVIVPGTWSESDQRFTAQLPGADACHNGQYVLLSYNTSLDGSGTKAAIGQSVLLDPVIPGRDTTFYFAQWGVPITFDFNAKALYPFSASATCPTQQIVVPFGQMFSLPSRDACQPNTSRVGMGAWGTIDLWSATADPHLVAPGSQVAAFVPTTFYVWWSFMTTVTFDANGGTCKVSSRSLPVLSFYALPDDADCSRPGYRLVGWAGSASAERPYFRPGAQVNAIPGAVLYAQWVSVSSHCDAPPAANVDWSGCDKRGAQLAGVDLANANLTNTLLDNANLDGVSFEACTAFVCIRGVNAPGAQMPGASMRNLRLGTSTFTDANLSRATLTGSVIGNAGSFYSLNMWLRVDLNHAVLDSVGLASIYLSDADFSGVSATDLALLLATAPRVSFVGASMPKLSVVQSDLTGSNFTKANLSGAVFDRVDLTDVTFTGADLTGVTFKNCTMKGATFVQANQTGMVITS